LFENKKEIKKEKRKKKGEIGVAGATPCPKNGMAGPPHFWPRGGRPPHTGCMGVAEATLGLWGWSGHPERPKKKKGKWVLAFGGGFGHHLPVLGGGRSHPQVLGGGPTTPKIPNPFFHFFFWGLLGWSDYPQRPGVALATPIQSVWGGRPPLGQKWGGPATPISPFFFFSSFFFIFFFFKKKKS
jgi:hypothetical protein